jgi:antitoxin ParD1/3/4
MQMNVSLPPELYNDVQKQVKSGYYSNASEVVRDALRRLNSSQKEELAWSKLRQVLADAEDSGQSNKSISDIANMVLNKNV